MQNNKPKLLTKQRPMLVFIAALFLFCAVLGAYTLTTLKKLSTDETNTLLQNSALLSYNALTSWVHNHKRYSHRLANSTELVELVRAQLNHIQDPAFPSQVQEIRLFFERNNISDADGFMVISPAHTVIVSSSNTEMSEIHPIVRHHPSLLQNVFAGNTELIPPIQSDRPPDQSPEGRHANDRLSMYIISPVMDGENRASAVLALRFEPHRFFSNVLKRNDNGRHGEINLFSNDHMLTDTSYNFSDHYSRHYTLPEQVTDMTRGSEKPPLGYSQIETQHLDHHNKESLGVWIWIPEFKLGVVAEHKTSEALSSYYTARNTFAVLYIFGAVILILFINMINRLSAQLHAELNQANQQLENRVQERTEALRDAHDEILRHQETLNKVIQSAPDAMIGIKQDGTIILTNQKSLELFGHNRDEMINQNIQMLMPRSNRPQHHHQIAQFFATKALNEVREVMAITKNGEAKPIDINLSTIELNGEQIALANIRDISDRKKLENELRQSEELYRMMFTTSPLGLARFDEHGRVTNVNDRFCQLVNRKCTLLENRSIQSLFKDSPEHLAVIENALNGQVDTFSGEYLAQDHATPMSIQAIYNPIISDDNIQIGGVATLVDITQLKNAERERDLLNQELARAQKMESIGMLAGGIAHDFNNMLSPIVGYAQLALDEIDGGNEELVSYMNQIIKSGMLASEVVNQLLTFARSEVGEPMRLDPSPLLKEVAKFLSPTLPTTVTLSHDLDQACGSFIKADPVQIHQCVVNLIVNARDALADRRGAIKLSMFQEHAEKGCTSCHQKFSGDYVVISVKDDGCGIKPELLDHIFQPFFTTKEVGRGTGMGLSMIHGILHSYGGHIVVNSAPNKGTEVLLYFPVPKENEKTSEFDDVNIPVIYDGNARVMIIDDEITITNYLRDLLKGHGYTVTAFCNAQQALEEFMAHPDQYDLIATDQTMPNLKGDEIAAAVKERYPETPILLFSGYNTKIDSENASEHGVDEYLSKPISAGKFLAAVYRLTQPSQEAPKLIAHDQP